jgi:hypothetical protein
MTSNVSQCHMAWPITMRKNALEVFARSQIQDTSFYQTLEVSRRKAHTLQEMAAMASATVARFLLLLSFVASCESFISPTLPLLERRRISHARFALSSTLSDQVEPCVRVERVKQVVKVKDVATGVSVYLVGAMHYNPVSIRSVFPSIRHKSPLQ